MKAIRVFLKPEAKVFLDMGVADTINMEIWWRALKIDGAILAQQAIVPIETIHHVVLLDVEQQTGTFQLIPGGKPN